MQTNQIEMFQNETLSTDTQPTKAKHSKWSFSGFKCTHSKCQFLNCVNLHKIMSKSLVALTVCMILFFQFFLILYNFHCLTVCIICFCKYFIAVYMCRVPDFTVNRKCHRDVFNVIWLTFILYLLFMRSVHIIIFFFLLQSIQIDWNHSIFEKEATTKKKKTSENLLSHLLSLGLKINKMKKKRISLFNTFDCKRRTGEKKIYFFFQHAYSDCN